MAKVTYNSASVFFNTPQTNWYLDSYVPRNLLPSLDDLPYIIEQKYEYKPDWLAHNLYGNKRLWWIFPTINPDLIDDPIYDFKAGLKINIPTRQRVLSSLGL